MRASKCSILHTVIFMFLLIEGIFVPSITLHAAGSGNGVTKNITKKNDRFTVSASYGIDGYVAYDYPTQIKVTVESKENFTGSVRVIPASEYGVKKAAYGQDISLSANEAKTFSMIPTELSNNGLVIVQIVNDKGKIIYEEQDTVSISGYGDDLLIGILSDDYSALNYFDGIDLISTVNGEETANILQLDAEDLEGGKGNISILSYIIIDNYDTANLSEEEYSVLKEWVEAGGILVLSLGSNYQNVLHIFTDDFASGTLGSMDKKNVVWGGSGDSETDSVALSSVDVISFAMEDAKEMTEFSSDQTSFQKMTGTGSVIVLGYDLAMDPIAGFDDRKEIAKRLLEVTRTSNNSASRPRYGHDFSNLAGLSDDVKKPSVLLYGALLLFYVILVGPVLYLVLKGMKKREKIWIGIPVVALAFTGVIYLTGFIYRIRKPLVNTFTVIQLDGNAMKEDVYTGTICPKARDYSLQIEPKYSGFRRNTSIYNFFSDMDQNKADFDYLIQKKNNGTEIVLKNKQAFDTNTFILTAQSENTTGEIECDLHYYTYGFEGTVTNQTGYNLSGVVVYYDGHYYEIDQLKKDEQAVLKQEDEKIAMQYGMFGQSDLDLYPDDGEYRVYRVNDAMADSYVDVNDSQKGVVWGTIDSYVPQITGDGDNWKQNGFGVVYQKFTGKYEDYVGVYCPDIRQTILTNRGDFDHDSGMLYADIVNITCSLEEYPGITTLQNMNYDQQKGITYADVYAYNAQTDSYEQIFKNSDTLSGTELKKYLNNNILILEFRYVNAEMNSVYMPKITAKGDE